ncbi:MAG: hypothetical protein Q4G00_12180 [Clostridia bacterium]|nr:hypothetical protein [Clostridia bacterium]
MNLVKIILTCLLIAALLMPFSVLAETDYSSLSEEELITIQEEVTKELLKRNDLPFAFVSNVFGFHMPVSISSSDDPHIYYLPDFIGKNLASINIVNTSIGNNFYYFGPREDYTSKTNNRSGLWLEIVSVDGEYVDVSDKELLKQYTVIWQSPVPNTAVQYTFEIDIMSINLGEKIENYDKPTSQSLETLTLYVVKNK